MVKYLSQQKRVLLTSTVTCLVHSENLITSLAFLTASVTERSREELKQKMAGFLSEGPACQEEKKKSFTFPLKAVIFSFIQGFPAYLCLAQS